MRGIVSLSEREQHPSGRSATEGWYDEEVAGIAVAAQRLLTIAVVFERLGGASWTQVGNTLDVTKQSAQERFGEAEARFRDELAHPENPDYTGEFGQIRYRLDPAARDPQTYAADLDEWVVRHRDSDDSTDDSSHPVSRGLARMDPGTELWRLRRQSMALLQEGIDGHEFDMRQLALAERQLVLEERSPLPKLATTGRWAMAPRTRAISSPDYELASHPPPANRQGGSRTPEPQYNERAPGRADRAPFSCRGG